MNSNVDHINQHLQITWSNIQHYERLRNNVFSLYLIIAGFFFALLKMEKGILPIIPVVCASSFFIWVIGVLLLWAFSRFSEMIRRDARVVRQLIERLGQIDKDNINVYNVYYRYYESFDKKGVSKVGSVNSCLTISISVISASVITVGVWVWASCSIYKVAIAFCCALLLNKIATVFFNWLTPVGNSGHKLSRILKSVLLIPVLNWRSIS